MMTERETTWSLSLRDVVRVLCRRSGIILSILVPGVLIVAVASFISLPIYEASAKVLLKRERLSFFHGPNESVQPHISQEIREQELNSELELLGNHSLLEAVVLQHRLYERPVCPAAAAEDPLLVRLRVSACQQRRAWWHWLQTLLGDKDSATSLRLTPQRLEKAIDGLKEGLNIIPIKQSNLILVRYRDRDPDLAAKVVNSLVQYFILKPEQGEQPTGVYELYQDETGTLRKHLQQAEERLWQFRHNAGIIDVAQQKALSLSKLADFEASLRSVEADIAATQGQIAPLKRQLAAQPEEISVETRMVQNDALATLKTHLMTLEVEYGRLREKFKANHPLRREMQNKIRKSKDILAQEAATRIQEQSIQRNPVYESIQSALLQAEVTLASLQARRQVLQQHVHDYYQISQQFDRQSIEIEALNRDAQLHADAYMAYMRKREEARFARVMDQRGIANLSMAEPAHAFSNPVAPRRKLNILLSLVLGSVVGVGIACIVDYTDHTFKTRDEVERHLSLPLLTSIPVKKEWG